MRPDYYNHDDRPVPHSVNCVGCGKLLTLEEYSRGQIGGLCEACAEDYNDQFVERERQREKE